MGSAWLPHRARLALGVLLQQRNPTGAGSDKDASHDRHAGPGLWNHHLVRIARRGQATCGGVHLGTRPDRRRDELQGRVGARFAACDPLRQRRSAIRQGPVFHDRPLFLPSALLPSALLRGRPFLLGCLALFLRCHSNRSMPGVNHARPPGGSTSVASQHTRALRSRNSTCRANIGIQILHRNAKFRAWPSPRTAGTPARTADGAANVNADE